MHAAHSYRNWALLYCPKALPGLGPSRLITANLVDVASFSLSPLLIDVPGVFKILSHARYSVRLLMTTEISASTSLNSGFSAVGKMSVPLPMPTGPMIMTGGYSVLAVPSPVLGRLLPDRLEYNRQGGLAGV